MVSFAAKYNIFSLSACVGLWRWNILSMRPGLCKASSICLRFLVVAIKTTPSCFSNLHWISTSYNLLLHIWHIFILWLSKQAKTTGYPSSSTRSWLMKVSWSWFLVWIYVPRTPANRSKSSTNIITGAYKKQQTNQEMRRHNVG